MDLRPNIIQGDVPLADEKKKLPAPGFVLITAAYGSI